MAIKTVSVSAGISLALLFGSANADSSSDIAAVANRTEPSSIQLPVGVESNAIQVRQRVAIRGHDDGSVLQLSANTPAISIESPDPVVIDGLTIRWQLATSDVPAETAAAVVVKDTDLTLKNCRIEAIGNDARCPTALAVTGFSKVRVENCHFEGFNFTITSSGGAEITLAECTVRSPGHCGVSVSSASSLELDHCLVTGSKFHGVRCTGGRLDLHDCLIIGNKNRGIYLGNKPAEGRVVNNVIHSNGAGISSFGSSEVTIRHNVFIDNTFSGIDSRETCALDIAKNIFVSNNQGFVLFNNGGVNQMTFGSNNFWANEVDIKDHAVPDQTTFLDPGFLDATNGDFTATSETLSTMEFGLRRDTSINEIWKLWKTKD